jgi:hypothetical protein
MFNLLTVIGFFTGLNLIFPTFSYAHIRRCSVINNPKHLDEENAKSVTQEWYTPYTTHFAWNSRYCGTTEYDTLKQRETQYFIKPGNVKYWQNRNPQNWDRDKKFWNTFVNEYKTLSSGVADWTLVQKFLGKEIKILPTRSYVVSSKESPNGDHLWWTSYYCGNLKFITEGIDVRLPYLPRDKRDRDLLLEEVRRSLFNRGLPEHLINKLHPTNYKGCKVIDEFGEYFIVD